MNLFSGCIAAVLVFMGKLEYAAYFVFAAALFDLLDGMVARRVNANSAFGKELDSLADVVTFGFVPGALMYMLMNESPVKDYFTNEYFLQAVPFFPFLITVFSALRLAKFNIDTRQSQSFLGLPTPANTLMIVSFPLIISQYPGELDHIILNPIFLMIVTTISCFLLVSEIPLFALKFKTTGFSENKFQYTLVILALILIPLMKFAAVPILIISYLLLSFIQQATLKKN